MSDPADLLEAHRRVHYGMRNLLNHCRQLTDEELHRALPDIGMPTVQE